MCCKRVQEPCRSCNPLDIQQLTFPGDLWFVLVNPVFEAPTAEMRAVLPKQVAMSSAIHNCAMGGSLVRPTPVAWQSEIQSIRCSHIPSGHSAVKTNH